MQKPNIVLILTDDQGYWSLGSYGNKEVISPNLDRLAAEGIKFDNCYCTSPVCSPARASIMTGKMPSQHGVLDWLGGGAIDKKECRDLKINHKKSWIYLADQSQNREEIPEDEEITFEKTATYQRYMNFERGDIDFLEGQKTFAEILKDNGYSCGLSGKWHLGSARYPHKGFDFWEPIIKGGTNYRLGTFFKDGKPVIKEGYVTDLITDEALRFISDTDSEQPFFLSVNYNAPHDPWMREDQPEELLKLYEECEFSSYPDEPDNPTQVAKRTRPKSPEQLREFRQVYYACITGMDRGVGRIVERLEQEGKLDNTIIIFTADNGMNLGHHGIWGKGNGTFPINMYETSVKVPCIVYGKRFTGRTGDCRTLISHYDLFPTILDLAGISEEEISEYTKELPGTSILPVIDGSKEEIREDVVVYDEYGPTRMVRTREYKLIYRTPFGPHELYDLKKDPDERVNEIKNPEYQKVKEMLYQKLAGWFERYTVDKYDGRKYPVDGDGQMERLENYGTDKTVFKSF